MKRYALLALGLLPLLAGCPKKEAAQEAPRDYEGVRQRANSEHKSLDSQRGE